MFASIKALLSVVVDYAGLFPPAALDMATAVSTYEQCRATPESWMLGRFVLPASRLSELSAHLAERQMAASNPWPVSVIVKGDAEAVHQLSLWADPKMTIAALEFIPRSVVDIKALLPHLPVGIDTFFELPIGEEAKPYLAMLAGTGAFAKVRTGGITLEAFPRGLQLAEFLLQCAEFEIPFKATAGLHHPLPGYYPLTYEPDSCIGPMPGFLNLLVTAALVYHQKLTVAEVLEALEVLGDGDQESRSGGFEFEPDRISWRQHTLSLSEIETSRRKFFLSFGSCSFQEPIAGLRELKLLKTL